MSVVTIQLGQCGTQVGQALFDCLAAEIPLDHGGNRSVSQDAFFRVAYDPTRRSTSRKRRYARAVLVDMEPKVINTAISAANSSSSDWCYAPRSSYAEQSGSGNNWARGHNLYGPKHAEVICELVRHESMAGGTGAGLGTYAAEALRDTFPASFLMNLCIWPYQSGEVVVQSYNTLLTLSHLTEVSDGIMLMENSSLHSTCQRSLNIQRPSFTDMNAVAARSLASVLLPAMYRPASGGSNTLGKPVSLIGDIVESLCCHPAYRMLSLRSVPQMPAASLDFTTFSWTAILRRLRQMQITGSLVEDGLQWGVKVNNPEDVRAQRINKSLAALLTLRGEGARLEDVSSFSHPAMYPAWAVQPLSVAWAPQRFAKCEMSASLLANDQTCTGLIRSTLDKAYKMFDAGAYLHQYKQFGLERQEFDCCFARCEETYAAYESM